MYIEVDQILNKYVLKNTLKKLNHHKLNVKSSWIAGLIH